MTTNPEKFLKDSISTCLILLFLLILSACGGSESGTPQLSAASDASLASLTISSGNLSPAFQGDISNYTATVDSSVSAITVLAATTNSNASINIQGNSVVSGVSSSPVPLVVGVNSISIITASVDGQATRTYTINVTRNSNSTPSSDATLSQLTISSGSLGQVFQPMTFSYTATVNFSTTNLFITPTSTNINASITVQGAAVNSDTNSQAIALVEGLNSLIIIVTAEDGITQQTYSLDVTRESSGSNTLTDASLSNIKLSAGSLSQVFQSEVYIYNANVDFTVTSLSAIPTSTNANAGITVQGNNTTSGTNSAAINLSEGLNTIDIQVTAEDGVTTSNYQIRLTRASVGDYTEKAFLKATTAVKEERFGRSVDLSGDTLVIGASQAATATQQFTGAVYVFTRTTGVWTEQARLTASNANRGDKFGYTVAVDGDTLIVGAVDQDTGGTNAGAAYVFKRNAGIWTEQGYLKSPSPQPSIRFGNSVDVSGDTAVVGSETGESVYVFTRDIDTWSYTTAIQPTIHDVGDRFGFSVALQGDNLAIGAWGEAASSTGGASDSTAYASGAAYVFTRVTGTWTQQAYLKASNAESRDRLGTSIALDGGTLVVGAWGEDSSATGGESDNSVANTSTVAPHSAGAAYVFTRDINNSWSQQAYLKASNAEALDVFSYAVAVSGDKIVVSAALEDSAMAEGEAGNGATDSGAAYVFTRSANVWTQQAYLKASNAGTSDQFGSSVTIENDTIVVGAPFEASSTSGGGADNSVSLSGATYVW